MNEHRLLKIRGDIGCDCIVGE